MEFAKPVLAEGADAGRGGARCARVGARTCSASMLRLLHPAMPFVTEELWDRFGYGAQCSLIRAPWPDAGRGARRGRGARASWTGWCG